MQASRGFQRWRSDIRDSLRLAVSNGVAAVLAFAFTAIAGRRLPPADFATLGAALAFLYLASAVVNPITSSVAHLFATVASCGEKGGLRRLLLTSVRRGGAWGACLAAAAWIASAQLANVSGWHDESAVIATGATVAAMLVLAPVRGALRGLDELGAFGFSVILEAGARIALGTFLLLAAPTASVALVAYALAACIAAVVGIRSLGLTEADETEGLAARLRATTLSFLLVHLMVAGFHNVDMLIVRRLADPANAALYAGAATVARIIGFLYVPFAVMVVPRVAAAESRGETGVEVTLRLTLLFALTVLPVVLLLCVAPGSIIAWLLGPRYAEAGPTLVRLAPAFLVGGCNALLAQGLAARRSYSFLLPLGLVLCVLVAVLCGYRGIVTGYADRVLGAQCLALVALAVTTWTTRRRR